MGVTEEGGTARGTPQERGESRNVEGGKSCWKNERANGEEESKTILRNREGESGREIRDGVSRIEEKEKRKKKKDSCWQGCFKTKR